MFDDIAVSRSLARMYDKYTRPIDRSVKRKGKKGFFSVMCLAIAMYVVTGTIDMFSHMIVRTGELLSMVLGRCILLACSVVYGISNGETAVVNEKRANLRQRDVMLSEEMRHRDEEAEDDDDDDDDTTMSQASLETASSLGSGRFRPGVSGAL